MQFELDNNNELQGALLKVIGVGGGGGNAINNMIESNLNGVGFIAANTDRQALEHNLSSVKIQLGPETTKGLGAGANPEIGKKAAEESINEIKKSLAGSDMVFVTAGMGGGTGTGGAPVVAKLAREEGSLVVAIVTKPFKFEGKKRQKAAEEWISKLREEVDALIVIPNERLLQIIDKNTTYAEAYKKVDEILYNATKGIADIIGNHGMINVDFADVRTIMQGMGDALMGIGVASGEDRALKATENALKSPLLDGLSIKGAKGVLVNISGSSNLGMMEIASAVSVVEEAAGSDAEIIHGLVPNDELGDDIMVTVVATGFNGNANNNHHNIDAAEPVQEEIFKKIEETKMKPKDSTVLTPSARRKIINNIDGSTRFSLSRDRTDVVPRGSNELRIYDSPAFLRNRNNEKEEIIEELQKQE
jgi:cell division protein FtsZ